MRPIAVDVANFTSQKSPGVGDRVTAKNNLRLLLHLLGLLLPVEASGGQHFSVELNGRSLPSMPRLASTMTKKGAITRVAIVLPRAPSAMPLILNWG